MAKKKTKRSKQSRKSPRAEAEASFPISNELKKSMNRVRKSGARMLAEVAAADRLSYSRPKSDDV